MTEWLTRAVAPDYDVLAPDGSEIRLLPHGHRGSMVHCQLAPGRISRPVRHRSVEELWFCLAGQGRLWRRDASGADEVVELRPGVASSIPVGVAFQFRSDGAEPLEVLITTMPPWPGPDEAMPVADGAWPPNVAPSVPGA